jgi:carbamoyltransferase
LNQKINELDWVDEMYVFPAMGDEGLSLGACIYKSVQLREWTKPKKLKNLYFGLKYSDDEVLSISKKFNFNVTEYVPGVIANDLNQGKIIGWFQDGFEYGPRALGARSILVRPTDIGTHEILNSRLKRYELMPFAPIVMEEFFDEIFIGNKSKYSAEFMTICYSTKEQWIEKIPAVIQKSDKTARPQLVKKDNSPKFWEILNEYNKLSNIPVLLNTSFNSHNQPIIDNPEDAFYSLESNIIDKLVIGNYVYTNK